MELIFYDTEFWTDEGVMARRWSGLSDHPPITMQIGAYKVRIVGEKVEIVDEFLAYLKPVDAYGQQLPVTDYFTSLTKITPDQIENVGMDIAQAMQKFSDFIGSSLCFSYGRDDLGTLAQTCYIANCPMPLQASQGRDFRRLLLKAGIAEKVIFAHTSGTIRSYFKLEDDESRHVHDARDDAYSLYVSFKYLLAQQKIPADLIKAVT